VECKVSANVFTLNTNGFFSLDGVFLVRESTNFPGDYTLCVCFQVTHLNTQYRNIFELQKRFEPQTSSIPDYSGFQIPFQNWTKLSGFLMF
jgi:hypothetical protein